MIRYFVLAAPLVVFSACYSFTPPDGRLPCSDDGRCPAGQECAADNICYDLDSTLNDDANLAALEVSDGTVEPAFDPTVTAYRVRLGLGAESLTVTPTASAARGVVIEVSQAKLASGQASEAIALSLGATVIEVKVTAASGREVRYELTVERGTGIAQQAYVKASNAEAGDTFSLVSLSNDGRTVAVAADGESSGTNVVGGDELDNSANSAGAVYIFVRQGRTWVQQAYIKASNSDAFDVLGFSIALSGDGNTLAVGAIGEASTATGIDGNDNNNDAREAGAVYVFGRNGNSWTQQAYVKASNTDVGDSFGSSVDLSADGSVLVVGAANESSASTGVGGAENNNDSFESGAVYVFERGSRGWTQTNYIKASNNDPEDGFGGAVALSDDATTLAVGASTERSSSTGINGVESDNSAMFAGAVYVFVQTGGTWSQQAYIKASNTDAFDFFGSRIVLSEDGNTLAVAAGNENSGAIGIDSNENDNSAVNAGAVYVFSRVDRVWEQQAYVKSSNTNSSDGFGGGLSICGDTMAVGASGEDSATTGIHGDQSDNSASGAGAVYLFIRRNATWLQVAYLKASNTDADDGFGDVALAGDTLVVGAFREASAAVGVDGGQSDNSAALSGAVYVFQ